MFFSIAQFLIILHASSVVNSLDKDWLYSVKENNCSSILHIPLQSTELVASDQRNNNVNISTVYLTSSHPGPSSCPPWHFQSPGGHCVFADPLSNIVHRDNRTMQTTIQHLYCMTTGGSHFNSTVVGGCLFSVVYRSHPYVPLPCNASMLDDYMCAGLHREGPLCGRCKEGFAPSVYSYSLRCVNCTNYRYNWIKYILIAYVPLTVFFVFVCQCSVNPTSAYLHGFVYFGHILCLPIINRVFVLYNEFFKPKLAEMRLAQGYFSLFGFWNLDFFRYFYEPFCIHPNMTVLQTLSLDYLIALYPLVLLLLTYIILHMNGHSCRRVAKVCTPCCFILNATKRKINKNTSLINSFATLLLLSTIKFQSVTFDLLMPTQIYNMNGSSDGKLFLFWAGNVEYFGPEHLPFGIVAVAVLITLVVFPALLLCLYPCHWFQMLLNKTHCNSLVLHTFMDAFQGNYKNGTNSTRDYRYFTGIFFLSKTFVILSFTVFDSVYTLTVLGTVFLGLSISMALLHPQKSRLQYTMDILYVAVLSILFFSANTRTQHFSGKSTTGLVFNAITIALLALPLLYLGGLIFVRMVTTLKRNAALCFRLSGCLSTLTLWMKALLRSKAAEDITGPQSAAETNERKPLLTIP